MTLLPHQVVGRDFLLAGRNRLLADDMRVGKSVQTIAAIAVLSMLGRVDVRVVCPASLRTQWRRQFDEFLPRGVEVCLQVISYEEAVKVGTAFSRANVLVVDESHYCKTRDAKRTLAVFGPLAAGADRVWCLSGTPAPNNASELYPMLSALFRSVLDRSGKHMNFWQFRSRYCRLQETPFDIKIVGNKNADELRDLMSSFTLRRTAEEVYGRTALPDEALYLDAARPVLDALHQQIRAELTAAVADRIEAADEEGAARILSSVEEKVRSRLTRLTGLAKAKVLADVLTGELESGLDKVVIWCWHVDVADALAAEMSAFRPQVLTGDRSQAERQAAVDVFQRDPRARVFIGQIRAAGVGLDLSAACEAVFCERSWVPGENRQAAARITGFNQKRATRVRTAVLAGSIDEKLTSVNTRKSEDARVLLGDAA